MNSKIEGNHTVKKYCWFNLKNEVTWLPSNVKFIEMKKLSFWCNHQKLKILLSEADKLFKLIWQKKIFWKYLFFYSAGTYGFKS